MKSSLWMLLIAAYTWLKMPRMTPNSICITPNTMAIFILYELVYTSLFSAIFQIYNYEILYRARGFYLEVSSYVSFWGNHVNLYMPNMKNRFPKGLKMLFFWGGGTHTHTHTLVSPPLKRCCKQVLQFFKWLVVISLTEVNLYLPTYVQWPSLLNLTDRVQSKGIRLQFRHGLSREGSELSFPGPQDDTGGPVARTTITNHTAATETVRINECSITHNRLRTYMPWWPRCDTGIKKWHY